ncbi:AAA family ATPase [Halomonas sp. HMF6819]|uniref:AAA family ATPase n=1 Tax=Halomonas sp. HMF6819 TaxID=3373085 RepID=UPI0037A32EBA
MSAFPFAGVVGYEPLKTALTLNVIDPRIGGVLISGPRGSAKSTLARALAALLPQGESGQAPFVTLPLGASEDRLTGSLDVNRVLADGEVHFQPGLLARAHGGILYVDEVNLLADTLVDLLLDVAASGTNVVERDGVSHTHPARFSLIGTMNPDEGELRPQLLDRFGLCVEQPGSVSVAERIAIVRSREAFDRDPHAFIAAHLDTERALIERIARARARVDEIDVPDQVFEQIARRCDQAAVEGLRADVTWHRAARAHAAWREVSRVEQADIDAVEPWVLAHRRTAPLEPPGGSNSGEQNGDGAASGSQKGTGGQRSSSSPSSSSSSSQDSGAGQWGAMPPLSQRTAEGQAGALKESAPSKTASPGEASPGGAHPSSAPGAGRLKRQPGPAPRLDVFATITANRGARPWRALKYRPVRTGAARLHLVLLDTSGSTFSGRLLGRAKGFVEALAHQAYIAREQLAVYGFGNDAVTPLLSRQRAPKSLAAMLDAVGAGGGTPLAKMVSEAAGQVRQWQRREPGLDIRTYLITDGRTRESLVGLAPLGECHVLDIEQSRVKRGQGPRLARELNARYQILPFEESP